MLKKIFFKSNVSHISCPSSLTQPWAVITNIWPPLSAEYQLPISILFHECSRQPLSILQSWQDEWNLFLISTLGQAAWKNRHFSFCLLGTFCSYKKSIFLSSMRTPVCNLKPQTWNQRTLMDTGTQCHLRTLGEFVFVEANLILVRVTLVIVTKIM